MPQTWEQALVNAQVEVNRAVFEMNRPGALATDLWYAKEPRLAYINECVTGAIADLQACLRLLPGYQTALFESEVNAPPNNAI